MAAFSAATVFLPGPTSPLPDTVVVGLLALIAVTVIAAGVALVVIIADVSNARHPRSATHAQLPAPETPRDTVGPTGELIDHDEPRHRLMELR